MDNEDNKIWGDLEFFLLFFSFFISIAVAYLFKSYWMFFTFRTNKAVLSYYCFSGCHSKRGKESIEYGV